MWYPSCDIVPEKRSTTHIIFFSSVGDLAPRSLTFHRSPVEVLWEAHGIPTGYPRGSLERIMGAPRYHKNPTGSQNQH